VDARYTRSIFNYRERLHARVLAEATNNFQSQERDVVNTTASVNSAGVITTARRLRLVLGARIADLQLGIKIDF